MSLTWETKEVYLGSVLPCLYNNYSLQLVWTWCIMHSSSFPRSIHPCPCPPPRPIRPCLCLPPRPVRPRPCPLTSTGPSLPVLPLGLCWPLSPDPSSLVPPARVSPPYWPLSPMLAPLARCFTGFSLPPPPKALHKEWETMGLRQRSNESEMTSEK